MKDKRIYNLIVYIIGVVIFTELDQITKAIAESKLYNKADFPIIKDILELTYLRNSGAAWGMLSGRISFFAIITVVMFCFITYVVIRLPFDKKYYSLLGVCTLLGAGAVGNFIDRMRFGYVRDFIYFKIINFPVFNVADICVTVSMFILIVLILFIYKDNDFDFIYLKKNKESKKDND